MLEAGGLTKQMKPGEAPAGKRRPRLAAVALGAVLALGLVACTSPAPTPESSTPTATTPAETPAPPPVLAPELSASENLPYFNLIAGQVLAADPAAGGAAFVDALTAAGFDKTQMEVTFDKTSIDLDADSIQFSVRFNGECLIGQTGPASDGYHSVVAPFLGTGTCLVGATRPIDW